MADVAKRLKALAGTVTSFAADLFDGRMGIHTDGPAGGPQWAVRVAGVWQYAARGLVDGWADNKGYKVNGVTAIAADRSISATGGAFSDDVSITGDCKATTGVFNHVVSSGGYFIGPAQRISSAGDGSFESISAQDGIGAFGVTPPATQPTVNADAADLATVIALTNQLRAALLGCGIAQ